MKMSVFVNVLHNKINLEWSLFPLLSFTRASISTMCVHVCMHACFTACLYV